MSLLSRLAVQAARAYGVLSSKNTNVSADFLVVAGGGGSQREAGGGAGGYRTSAGTSGGGGSAESALTLSTLTTYTVTIGAGGVTNSNGSNSVFSTITSTGGGRGTQPGASGGSGGGGGRSSDGPSRAGGAGTANHGYAGGAGANKNDSGGGGGGGGGAGAVGTAAAGNYSGGNGGNGVASSISGTSTTYAGGGAGGGGSAAGTAGSGGGGAGATSGSGSAGTANTGGGGGGGNTVGSTGSNGGSGIVIISYTSATPKFVGGTLTTSGGKQIHTFTSSGTLSPITPVTASYLVVAGGGSGSTSVGFTEASGGGGAGGLLSGSTTIYSGATYVVTVGAGGAGPSTYAGTNNGSNSVLSGTGLTTLTSIGGGAGNADSPGVAGGSGGGGGAAVTSRAGGTGTAGQGNNGGSGFGSGTNSLRSGGGGGGSSAVGANAASAQGGAGGAGTASSITGTSVTYAAGGGGSSQSAAGSGGSSIGGNGQGLSPATSTTSGTVNTGSGGGAAVNTNGGSGGSGIVIISYAGSQAFNGGLVTSSGGNTIHTFLASGALTPLTNNLTNSLRFRGSANAYLSRTPSTTGNQRTFTWSGWVKRGALGTNTLFDAYYGNNTRYNLLYFNSSDNIRFFGGVYSTGASTTTSVDLVTTQVFRDPSAWYHLVLAVDTTQATAANRVKLYVNGSQVTSFSTSTYPAQNDQTYYNVSTTGMSIGSDTGNAFTFDGYMTDVYSVDGQALEPYYFGNNDANGVWKPILYKGTYGTNGFYLTFGNTTSTTTLGYDSSPNGNNWTTNNISLTAGVTYDAMLDVPTNTSATVANYCTLNPIRYGIYPGNPAAVLSEGNLKASWASDPGVLIATMNIPSTGKWYWEAVVPTQTYNFLAIGVIKNQETASINQALLTPGYAVYAVSGQKWVLNTASSYMAAISQNTVITVAFDADTGTLYIGAGGLWANGSGSTNQTFSTASSVVTGLTGDISPAFSFNTGNFIANFGQRPFTYTPPTGFVALNTFNLPTPTILQGNKYMDATLYTGTGTTQVIVNQGQFKPDLVWLKVRSTTGYHGLIDSVRGRAYSLFSNATDAEGTSTATQDLVSFNSNGFTVGVGSQFNSNGSGNTLVGWQWQAGQGSSSSNTSGSITSTVSVNTTAGFSVVTYTGTGSNATVGHGLGVAPKMVIWKRRNTSQNWAIWHQSLATPTTALLEFTTDAQFNDPSFWNSTIPNATNLSLGTFTSVNASGGTYVAYCWAEIAGFSKFGSYTGNGSADGTFVYTGFRPEFIMIKGSSSGTAGSSWIIQDTSRNIYNAAPNRLFPNTSDAEGTSSAGDIDILSNGFKLRNTSGSWNANGETYIYMAFAEHPFKNANAR